VFARIFPWSKVQESFLCLLGFYSLSAERFLVISWWLLLR
jgi:hypothetical protein